MSVPAPRARFIRPSNAWQFGPLIELLPISATPGFETSDAGPPVVSSGRQAVLRR
jgi:hypothetical protein